MAVAALVLGLVGSVFGLIPLTFWIALPCGILAVIFGVVGRRRAKEPGRSGGGMAIAGLILGLIAVALGIAGIAIIGDAVDDLDRDLEELEQEFNESQGAPPFDTSSIAAEAEPAAARIYFKVV